MVKGVLDELVGCWEMLEQVLVLYIVHFDDHVFERAEQVLVERHAEHRQDVSNISLLESVTPAQGEHAIESSVGRS